MLSGMHFVTEDIGLIINVTLRMIFKNAHCCHLAVVIFMHCIAFSLLFTAYAYGCRQADTVDICASTIFSKKKICL